MTAVVDVTASDIAAHCPYRGLTHFTERDAPFFFGREHETRIIAANLLANRLTLVYGPSGIGKSSLLGAGVMHHLHRLGEENRRVTGSPGFLAVAYPGEEAQNGRRRASWSVDPLDG